MSGRRRHKPRRARTRPSVAEMQMQLLDRRPAVVAAEDLPAEDQPAGFRRERAP